MVLQFEIFSGFMRPAATVSIGFMSCHGENGIASWHHHHKLNPRTSEPKESANLPSRMDSALKGGGWQPQPQLQMWFTTRSLFVCYLLEDTEA